MLERVLSLDMSTKTGWAFILSGPDSVELVESGQFSKTVEPEGQYPGNYVDWAITCYTQIALLIQRFLPTVLVIEETAGGSKNAMSQKILEFIHFTVANHIKATGIKTRYYMTEQWRRLTGCQLTKEESKRNKEVSKQKKEKGVRLARDLNGKIMGKVGRKHVNVRRANEVFGQYLKVPLQKKDEDRADALMLAYAYHVEKLKRASDEAIERQRYGEHLG